MKIEMGESLFYSWLRHVKECHLVQMNWKVSSQWDLLHEQELEKLEQDYFIFSTKKYEDNKYSEADLLLYMELIKQHFYHDGIINCPYIEDNNIVDNLLLIPKTIINI